MIYNSASQSATSRKGGKNKSSKSKVVSNSSYQRSIPLLSSGASPSNHPDSNGAGSSFSPPYFASSHTTHSSNGQSPISYNSTTADGPPVSSYSTNGDHRYSHVDWPSPISTGSFMTHVGSPHSPIASLAPHSTHTLPFTTLSRGNNENVSIRSNNSLPYYYPPEWNRDDHDIPDWNRVDPPEWSRTDFMDNTSPSISTFSPPYSMDTTSQFSGPSPSLLSSWEEPLDLDVTGDSGNSQANGVVNSEDTASSISTLTSVRDEATPTSERANSEMGDSPFLTAVLSSDDHAGDVRMTQSRRESIGQRRRRGVSYSSDEHQSMLQELLSPQPEELLSNQPATSTPYFTFSPRPYGPLSSNRVTTVRSGQSGRVTPDVLSDDYTTRRRSARVCPGRSRLDVLQHRPVRHDLSDTSSSSSLLESDNSPVLPLEDIAGILSDLEQNNHDHPPQHLRRGYVTADVLSTPTTTSQPISNFDRSDVITISSDEVCMFHMYDNYKNFSYSTERN